MIMMPLRNMSSKDGLHKGTKLIFKKLLENKLFVCKFPSSDKTVLIPRIKFITDPKFYSYQYIVILNMSIPYYWVVITNTQG